MADGTDVEVAGKSKWDTLEEAHVAARLVEEARKRLTESEATLAAALDAVGVPESEIEALKGA